MKLFCKGTVLTVVGCFALLICTAGAAHVTTYLDPLQSAVTNSLADTNLTAAQTRSLQSANKILGRNAKKPQAELVLLASAAKALNARFTNDFLPEENDALDGYSYDAHGHLLAINSAIATNPVPRSVSNNLNQAITALARGDDADNSVPVRARALALSLTKLGVAAKQVIRALGTAPASVEDWRSIRLEENAPINDRTFYNLETSGWVFDAHEPEELGLWSYQRTGRSNATVTVMPNWPSNDVPRDFRLIFTNLQSGIFSGTNQHRESIQGTFLLNR